GGAQSFNVILSRSNAYLQNSLLASGSDVTLRTTNGSDIEAKVVALAVAIGFGKKVGAGVAIGVSISKNFIGFDPENSTWNPAEVQAYLQNSSVTATGNLSITADATEETIDARVAAAAAAIAAGRSTGVALAGSGVDVENKIS